MERPGTVTILGVGLIGGSVGLALKARGLAGRVIGIGRNPEALEEARRLGAIDAGTTDPAAGLAGADVAVVCTPVSRIAEDVRLAARLGPPGLLIADAGSAKRRITEAAADDDRARARFVPAHPIAGSEKKGVAHARADLFDGRPCVLTPLECTPEDALSRARRFWGSVGCRVLVMTPAAHDDALALTSHLPHVVAAALAAAVPEPLLGLTGGAFRDGTRVAAADTALWLDILRDNRGPLLDALDAFDRQWAGLRRALDDSDDDALRAWWDRARGRRDLLTAAETLERP